jgi:hypothetical protein
MSSYTPRRQSKRWLDEDCPQGVLAIYDNGGKTFDRYTVFYREPITGDAYHNMWLGYRGMSEHPFDPQGFGIYSEMQAHEVAQYRYRASHDACKWSDLPDDVKRAVRMDCEGN